MGSSEDMFVKDEKNLAIIPFANLSKNHRLSRIEIQVTKDGDGQRHTGTISVETSEGRYLPNAFDEDVLYAIFKKLQDQGLKNRKVKFTKYELLNILGLNYGGQNYRRISKAIENLALVKIIDSCFYDREQKKFGKRVYNIFSDAFFSNADKGQDKIDFKLDGEDHGDTKDYADLNKSKKDPDTWYVEIGDLLFSSMKNGYMKDMNLTLFFSFKKSTTRRLYKILDYFFTSSSTLEYELKAFSKNLMGSTTATNTKMRSLIRASVAELYEHKIIKKHEFFKRNRIEYVFFEKGDYYSKPKVLLESLSVDEIIRLKNIKDNMRSLGISPNCYDEIINQTYTNNEGQVDYDDLEERLKVCLEVKRQNIAKNKRLHGGYFRKALTQKWTFDLNPTASTTHTEDSQPKKVFCIKGLSEAISFKYYKEAIDFCHQMMHEQLKKNTPEELIYEKKLA